MISAWIGLHAFSTTSKLPTRYHVKARTIYDDDDDDAGDNNMDGLLPSLLSSSGASVKPL